MGRRNEMGGSGRAPSIPAAPGGIASRNGLGPGRLIEIQRARILGAMVAECAERGIGNVSVAHVVARAGVSRRTFYEIFADREDCFLGAFDEALARASTHVLEDYDPNAKWIERLRVSITGLLSFLEVEREAGQLLVVGSLGSGAAALERRRHVVSQAIVFVDEGRNKTKHGAELPPLTAEGIVGGVVSVLHSRLFESPPVPLMALAGPLMSMITMPYLGPAAARRELSRPVPSSPRAPARTAADPLRDLGIRLTYRTVRVLFAVAATPGGSNRQVAGESGITDQGQISKLLTRLHKLGLIENTSAPTTRGAPNSWVLTDRGWEVQSTLTHNTTTQ